MGWSHPQRRISSPDAGRPYPSEMSRVIPLRRPSAPSSEQCQMPAASGKPTLLRRPCCAKRARTAPRPPVALSPGLRCPTALAVLLPGPRDPMAPCCADPAASHGRSPWRRRNLHHMQKPPSVWSGSSAHAALRIGPRSKAN